MKIISHYPTINSTGVFRNEPIKIYFDTPIDARTIAWDTFSLNDSATFASVVGDLGPLWESGVNLSGVSSGLVFVPTLNLLPNTEYTVYVYGAPNSVVARNRTQLTETYSYSFVTGTGYYTNTGDVGTPSGVDAAVLIDLSGIIAEEESSIVAFEVYSTNPINQKPNVAMSSINEITITFTGNITTPVDTLSGMITLDRLDVI